ncbi:MAG: metal ABC transporter permease [Thermoplasmata archaeon]|nr:metal ABC transporter permease [Thermoplasmata archaeon]
MWLPPALMITAVAGAVLAGFTCSVMGVFVVRMNLSSIGFAMSHAAFAGAAFGIMIGSDPLPMALLASFLVALVIGPVSHIAGLRPEIVLGFLFSLLIALGFLFLHMVPGEATSGAALRILWGSIFGVSRYEVVALGALSAVVVVFVALFNKEIAAMMFHRKLAEASGIDTQAFLTAILFMTGFSVALSLKLVGGLLVYALMINPTSTVYQFTFDFRKMVIGSPIIGMTTCLAGFWASLLWDLPVGTAIVLVSAIVLAGAIVASPKRRRG